MDQAWVVLFVRVVAVWVICGVAGDVTGQMVAQWWLRRHLCSKGMVLPDRPFPPPPAGVFRQTFFLGDAQPAVEVGLPEIGDPFPGHMAWTVRELYWERGLGEGWQVTATYENKSPEPELVRRRMYDGEVIEFVDERYILRETRVQGWHPALVRRLSCRGDKVKATLYVAPDMRRTEVWPVEDVTIVGPPVKPAKIAEATIDTTANWRKFAEGKSWAQTAMLAFVCAAVGAGGTKPEPIGRPADFVYSMGRRSKSDLYWYKRMRWAWAWGVLPLPWCRGGWWVRALLRRLAWATMLAGVGGAWWWVR